MQKQTFTFSFTVVSIRVVSEEEMPDVSITVILFCFLAVMHTHTQQLFLQGAAKAIAK